MNCSLGRSFLVEIPSNRIHSRYGHGAVTADGSSQIMEEVDRGQGILAIIAGLLGALTTSSVLSDVGHSTGSAITISVLLWMLMVIYSIWITKNVAIYKPAGGSSPKTLFRGYKLHEATSNLEVIRLRRNGTIFEVTKDAKTGKYSRWEVMPHVKSRGKGDGDFGRHYIGSAFHAEDFGNMMETLNQPYAARTFFGGFIDPPTSWLEEIVGEEGIEDLRYLSIDCATTKTDFILAVLGERDRLHPQFMSSIH